MRVRARVRVRGRVRVRVRVRVRGSNLRQRTVGGDEDKAVPRREGPPGGGNQGTWRQADRDDLAARGLFSYIRMHGPR